MNLSDLPKRIPKEEAISRIMKGLGVSREEAEDVYAYDQDVEHDSSVGVLAPDKEAVARKMAHTGTRDRKAPMVPNLPKKKRAPNATKGALVSELAEYMGNNSGFEVQGLQIPNAEQKVSFKIGEKWYTWSLTEHRTKPKWCAGEG